MPTDPLQESLQILSENLSKTHIESITEMIALLSTLGFISDGKAMLITLTLWLNHVNA